MQLTQAAASNSLCIGYLYFTFVCNRTMPNISRYPFDLDHVVLQNHHQGDDMQHCSGSQDNCAPPHEKRGHNQYRNDFCKPYIRSDCLHSFPWQDSQWPAIVPSEERRGKVCHRRNKRCCEKRVARVLQPSSSREISDDKTVRDGLIGSR